MTRAVLFGVLAAAVLVSLLAMAALNGANIVGNVTYTGFEPTTVGALVGRALLTAQLRSNLWPAGGLDASNILDVVPPTNSAAFIAATLLPAVTGVLTAVGNTQALAQPRCHEFA